MASDTSLRFALRVVWTVDKQETNKLVIEAAAVVEVVMVAAMVMAVIVVVAAQLSRKQYWSTAVVWFTVIVEVITPVATAAVQINFFPM